MTGVLLGGDTEVAADFGEALVLVGVFKGLDGTVEFPPLSSLLPVKEQ